MEVMKKFVSKKLGCLMLALAILLTSAFTGVTEVKAATDDDWKIVYKSDSDIAYAGVEKQLDFTVTVNEGAALYVYTDAPSTGTISFYNSQNKYLYGDSVYASDYETLTFSDGTQGYDFNWGWNSSLQSGDYTVGLKFDTDTRFFVVVVQKKVTATMSQSKLTLTAGFSKKLSVRGSTVKSWKSTKKSVATVNKKGKVTAKKAGNTTIVATLKNGKKLTCKVKVAANKYKDIKPTVGDCKYGDVYINPYAANFDKKGNLVVKIQCVNVSGNKVTGLQNLKIKVKDANGKTVGIYKQSKKSTTISSGSSKALTFTIKKSDLKKKKIDLRNAKISAVGKYIYTSYTYYY